jgi:two-component SAPR family response regulator
MSCKVIIVEDETLIADNLKAVLEYLGHNVVGLADNGLEAIRIAKDLGPNLIFMDIHIKGHLDGVETALLIDEIVEKRIAFIFETSFSPEPHRLKNLLGRYFWIQKPYTTEEIEEVIKQAHAIV